MAVFEITADAIRPVPETSFEAAGIRERHDLQRLLRNNIEVICPETLVIAEEFGDWDESRRRIDLLGIDREANLVVIELKRSEDGGHMELQAIRYSAMIAPMTFVQAVDVYSSYLRKIGSEADARASLLHFLAWEEPDEDRFAQDVKLVLVAAEFSKELTTSVMWLNERDLDIRCIRMKPYADNGRVLVDVQQVIPLPEAAAYQVQIREKERQERKDRAERHDLRRRFWEKLLGVARSRTTLHGAISPTDSSWIATTAGIRGLSLNYVIRQHETNVELYIDRGDEAENKAIFDRLCGSKREIEAAFDGLVEWQRLDDKRASRIKHTVSIGGYRNDESEWPAIQDAMVSAMIRLERALSPHIVQLRLREQSMRAPSTNHE